MNVDISNKVIVITGASKGIGKELAYHFSKEGANVVINYNSSRVDAKSIIDDICNWNLKCMIYKADMRNYHEVRDFYKAVLDKYKRVDVLINNAGICDDALIQMMTKDKWNNVIETNLTGTFYCCREFSKIMIKQNSGKIINIASLKGEEGCVGQVNYSASKAGIIGLTKSLAKELGKFNISVNAICPNFILTDLNKNNLKKKKTAISRNALKFNCGLEDLKSFVTLLSSNKLMGVSGRIFNLDSRIL